MNTLHVCKDLESTLPQVFVGDECTARRHELDISYPISNGLVQSWQEMQHVWDHTFEHVLRLNSSARIESRILLTEPPLNPISNRKRLLETMLETYNFAGVQVQIQAVLTLYSQGVRCNEYLQKTHVSIFCTLVKVLVYISPMSSDCPNADEYSPEGIDM